MGSDSVKGFIMIVFGGILQAMFMLPARWSKGWKFEHIWFVFSFFCYLLFPWLVVHMLVPHVATIITATSGRDLFLMGVYGTGWALAALGFGIGINLVGFSLGFAIIFGLSAFVGAFIPLLTSNLVSREKVLLPLPCLLLMLAGVAVCSIAGKWRERQDAASPLDMSHYVKGVMLCIVSGLLGATGNLGFVAGSGMTEIVRARGLSAVAANSLVLAYLCVFMFVVNAGYALVLISRHATFSLLLRIEHASYFLLGMSMGFVWMASFLLYGMGARALGGLGLSYGWGVFMCTVVISANVVGIAMGEWSVAPHAAKRQLGIGLSILVIAIAGLAFANSAV